MLSNSQIKQCNKCGAEIAFAQGSSGKWYPADVDRGSGKPELTFVGQGGFVRGKQRNTSFPKLHQCPLTRVEIEAQIARFREELVTQEAALESGEWGINTDVTIQAIEAWEFKLSQLA